MSHCEVEVDIANGRLKWVSASRIRSITIKSEGAESTVGKILTAEGASKYPTKIRYGCKYSHFPPDALVKTAYAVVDFAKKHWNKIRQLTADTADQ